MSPSSRPPSVLSALHDGAAAGAPRRGRRPGISLPQIAEAAALLLDEEGEPAFTVRALAARLESGVASLYWYVEGREGLLSLAAEHVLAQAVADTEALPEDPYAALAAIADALYRRMGEHPWLPGILMRDTSLWLSGLRLFDRIGRQLMRLDLTDRQRFHAATALQGYVVGFGAELADPPVDLRGGEVTAEEVLHEYADVLRGLDGEDFPFLRSIADEFEHHRDEEQFRAGVQLILDGVRAQAGEGPGA